MLPSALIPILCVFIVVVLTSFGLMTRNYMLNGLLLATPVVIFLINNRWLLFVLIIGLFPSNLLLPGFPTGLQLVHGLMVFFIGVTIAHNIISKTARAPMRLMHYALYGLLLVTVLTIYVRGLGMRSSGGDTIGGAAYVRLLAGVGFLLCARDYSLTTAQWRTCFFIIIGGSLLPVLAQLIYLGSGGRIHQHFVLIQPYVYGLMESLAVAESGEGMMRYHGLSAVGISLLGAGLAFMPFRGVMRVKFILLILACMGVAAFSGFRISIIEILCVTFLFILFSAGRGQRMRYFFGLLGALLFILLLMIPLIPYLPLTIQRSLSWLPLVEVSSLARTDAFDSVSWRLEVWEYSLQFWRDYAWIGRGLTVKLSEVYSPAIFQNLVAEAFASHNYHSGPVSLLLDLGIPGLVIGTIFLVSASLYALLPLDADAPPFIKRFHTLYRAKTIYTSVAFYLFFGDVKSSFIIVCIDLAILESIRASQGRIRTEKAPAPVTPKLRPIREVRRISAG